MFFIFLGAFPPKAKFNVVLNFLFLFFHKQNPGKLAI